MTRIALITPVGGQVLGGGEHVLLRLLSHLDQERFNARVIAAAPGRFSQAAAALGSAVSFVSSLRATPPLAPGPPDYAAFVAQTLMSVPPLIRELKQHPPDLIHTSSAGVHIAGGLAGKMTGVPVVMHFQSHPTHHRYYRILASICADAVVVASQATGDWLGQSAQGHISQKVHVVHAGVDSERFHPQVSGASVRSELGLERSYPVILTVGALEPRKGHLDLVSAIAIVQQVHPDLRLLIAGEELEPDSFRPVLSQHVTARGMDDHVILLGRRSDVPELFAAPDLFVLASQQDPYPNVVLEAMSSGCPVVATRSGGSAEIVVDDQTGLLVDPSKPEALAQAILSLVGDPGRMQAMGSAGRARIEDKARWSVFARSIEGVYQQVSQSSSV